MCVRVCVRVCVCCAYALMYDYHIAVAIKPLDPFESKRVCVSNTHALGFIVFDSARTLARGMEGFELVKQVLKKSVLKKTKNKSPLNC